MYTHYNEIMPYMYYLTCFVYPSRGVRGGTTTSQNIIMNKLMSTFA